MTHHAIDPRVPTLAASSWVIDEIDTIIVHLLSSTATISTYQPRQQANPNMSESFRSYVHPLEIPRPEATIQELLDTHAGEEWIWGQPGVGLYEG